MTYRPIRCPHGSELKPESVRFVVDVYEDGCRGTGGAPVRFWCGSGEMLKPNGVSITEGEYLRDWQDAIDEAYFRREAETNPEPVDIDFMRSHAEYLGEVPWSDRVDD